MTTTETDLNNQKPTINIPIEDLNKIKLILKNKELLTKELASIKLTELQLKDREAKALAFNNEISKLESELSKKYGNGSIQVDEGTFTPH